MGLVSRSIEFAVGNETVRGTFYLPSESSTLLLPGVVFGHGWSMVAGGDLEDYAKAVVQKGFAALTFDYRNLGKSTGTPRQHIDPQRQVEDFKAAISFLRQQAEVNPERIGIWGSSYGGGHVLTIAATDPRVRCVVSQVPTISSWRAAKARMTPSAWQAQWQAFTADREAVFTGANMAIQQTTSDNPAEPSAYPDRDSFLYMTKEGDRCPEWRNYTTLASLELARNYEPGSYLYRITDIPVLMIIANNDITTPHDLQREAFDGLLSPKQLLAVEGGHYSVYQEHFEQTSSAAASWFEKHLKQI